MLVDDDVAVEDSTWHGRPARHRRHACWSRRSPARSPRSGAELAAVAAVARKVNDAVRVFGIALTPCTTPAAGKPGFDLPEDEIEVGVGIHGEPGRRRDEDRAGQRLAGDRGERDPRRPSRSTPATRRSCMVNGLGGTPLIELYVRVQRGAELLAGRGVEIARSLVGNYVTSLDMAGCSLTVCQARRRADCGCGTRRSTPPACDGASEPHGRRTAAPRAWIAARSRRLGHRRRRTS